MSFSNKLYFNLVQIMDFHVAAIDGLVTRSRRVNETANCRHYGCYRCNFGIRLLEALKNTEVETHLVLSKWAIQTIEHETTYTLKHVWALATLDHSEGNMGATISSGSFVTEGMVVVPCSMRSLAAIAHGTGDHLIHRAADVILKERRKLVLVTREMPLSDVHLENMLKLSRMGVTIMPPMPAFYNRPT